MLCAMVIVAQVAQLVEHRVAMHEVVSLIYQQKLVNYEKF